MAELPPWTAGAGGGASKAEVKAVAEQVVGGDLKGSMPDPHLAVTPAPEAELNRVEEEVADKADLESGKLAESQLPDSVVLDTGATMSGPLVLNDVPLISRNLSGSNPFVAKPSTDENEGLLNWINDSPVGYLGHFTLGPNSTLQTAALGIGMDGGKGRGIILANKKEGQGLAIQQRASITSEEAYGLIGYQESAKAPLLRLELHNNEGADSLQLVAFGQPTAATRLLRVQDPTGNVAASIFASDGHVDLRRRAVIADRADKEEISYLTFETNSSAVAGERTYFRAHKAGLQWYSYSGTQSLWWPFKLEASGSTLVLQAGGFTGEVGGGALSTLLEVKSGKLGFFGTAAAARPNVKPAAEVSAKELCEALETLGLVE